MLYEAHYSATAHAGERRGLDPKRLRLRMVKEQIEARGVSDPHVLAAMRIVPRHLFVQEALAAHAYDDTSLPIGYGQTISQPFMVARMSELLEAERGMRVLEIGAGCGYQMAVLAAMGLVVYGIERVREIYQTTLARLRRMRLLRVQLLLGDGTLGLPPAAPFDRIIVSAGGPEIPPPLVSQLDNGGILLIPVGAAQRQQRLLRVHKQNNKIYTEDLGMAVFVDLIGNHGWQPLLPNK